MIIIFRKGKIMKKTIRFVAFAMVALMLMLTLASCGAKPNSDPDKALDALKENGIKLAAKDDTLQPAAYKVMGVKDVKCVVSGIGETKDGEDAAVYIIYFESASAANDAYDKVKDEAEKEKIEDLVIGKSGSMIYYGNKAGVKAAA